MTESSQMLKYYFMRYRFGQITSVSLDIIKKSWNPTAGFKLCDIFNTNHKTITLQWLFPLFAWTLVPDVQSLLLFLGTIKLCHPSFYYYYFTVFVTSASYFSRNVHNTFNPKITLFSRAEFWKSLFCSFEKKYCLAISRKTIPVPSPPKWFCIP